MVVEIQHKSYEDKKDFLKDLNEKLQYLVSARPTAVNIKIAAEELTRLAVKLSDLDLSPADIKEKLINF